MGRFYALIAGNEAPEELREQPFLDFMGRRIAIHFDRQPPTCTLCMSVATRRLRCVQSGREMLLPTACVPIARQPDTRLESVLISLNALFVQGETTTRGHVQVLRATDANNRDI